MEKKDPLKLSVVRFIAKKNSSFKQRLCAVLTVYTAVVSIRATCCNKNSLYFSHTGLMLVYGDTQNQ